MLVYHLDDPKRYNRGRRDLGVNTEISRPVLGETIAGLEMVISDGGNRVGENLFSEKEI